MSIDLVVQLKVTKVVGIKKCMTKKASEYDQETPQSHTTDQPMVPQGRAT